jgi:quercetin dioxygenase-like cupin family protein
MQTEKTPAIATQGDELQIFTNVVKFLVPQAATGYQYTVFEDNVPPLGGPPPHTHPDEEVFYVLAGEFEFILNDLNSPFRVEAGSVVHVPSNALHTFKNVGSTPGKMICISTPGRLEQYFRQIGTPIRTEAERPDLSLPPDLSKLDVARAFALAADYDVTFYLPELIS